MTLNNHIILPENYNSLLEATREAGFGMPSDIDTGALLRTLTASKPGGNFLEIGTGTGLATLWLSASTGKDGALTSIDDNLVTTAIANKYVQNQAVSVITADGYEWISNYSGAKFDLIFADAMPGKYDLFEETIALLNDGGFYIIDDMLPQPNWPEGHAARVAAFIERLDARTDLVLAKLNWSTGIIIATKQSLN